MKVSQLPAEDLCNLRIGDIVTIETFATGQVTAPIIKVEPQWGTDMLPIVTLQGHDPNWVGGPGEEINHPGCLEVGAHMVLKIISKAPYRVEPRVPRNIFREQMEKNFTRAVTEGRTEFWFHARNGAPRGQLRGTYREMEKPFCFALAKLPYEIATALHKVRAMQLWRKAGYPGLVRRPDPLSEGEQQNGRSLSAALSSNEHWLVSEKPFCRFVQQKWSNLVMTRAEMDAYTDDYHRWMQEDLWRAIEDDLDYLDDIESMDDPNHPLSSMADY